MPLSEGQASAEIEITPEIVQAGVDVFLEIDSEDPRCTESKLVVSEILQAALSAAR